MARVERNVDLAEELVGRQVELIADLESRARDATAPRCLMREFRELLATNIAERNRMRDESSVAAKVGMTDETRTTVARKSGVK
jgi:hypothetical protein